MVGACDAQGGVDDVCDDGEDGVDHRDDGEVVRLGVVNVGMKVS